METTRTARPSDARPISVVLLRSWETAYRGILPDEVLDAQCLEHFLPYWELTLASPGDKQTWVVERAGAVVGVAHAGPSRDDDRDPGRTAELYGIYVDPDHVGTGVGKALMAAVTAFLASGTWSEATLWVLPGNRIARAFYESFGWEAEGGIRTVRSATGHSMDHMRYRIDVARDPA